jgi:hypothetical protein
MKNDNKIFLEFIEKWIEEAKQIINPYKSFYPLSNFINKYIGILDNVKNKLDKKEECIEEFIKELNDEEEIEKKNPYKILSNYVETMTFKIDGKDIFLPCFSDECLKELTKSSLWPLSPFRGLYYGWKLGEIYRLFEKGKEDEAIIELGTLIKEVELSITLQSPSGNPYYWEYMKAVECPNGEVHPSLKIQVELLKKAMREIIFKLKAKWLGYGFPYPTPTSTHFYLSGIRFYLNPLVMQNANGFEQDERFYVQSTDSGLHKIEEHYGIILTSDDPDEMDELLNYLPAGCLVLDLSTNEMTDTDKKSIKYFERWSHLITTRTYHIISETLNYVDISTNEKSQVLNKKAKSYYMNQVKKNPLRKFYFDTGIFQALLFAKKGKLPKISYLTTNKSKVEPRYKEVSSKLLSAFLDEGIEYYLLPKDGWVDEYKPFENLTLVPYGKGIKRMTNSLISIRGEGGKIAHGVDSYALYLFTSQFNFKPEDIIPFLSLAGSTADIPSILSNLSNVVLILSRFIRALIKTTKDINKNYTDLENVRYSNAVNITGANLNLLVK